MIVIFLLLVVAVVIIVYLRKQNRYESKHPWQHFFDGVGFSSRDFYENVEAAIRDRKVDVDFSRELFVQSHIFSARREYLKISQGEYVFYVCAAPFGTGTFVSEWLCIKRETKLNNIPIVSKLAGIDRSNKSFYQVDTQTMYRSAIHSALLSVIDDMTAGKAVRGLTDLERTYQMSNN